jgi:hypothetical protein
VEREPATLSTLTVATPPVLVCASFNSTRDPYSLRSHIKSHAFARIVTIQLGKAVNEFAAQTSHFSSLIKIPLNNYAVDIHRIESKAGFECLCTR